MKFYHGTDQRLNILKENSYVSKNYKDACKFGYRRSVLSKKPFVYIYEGDIDDESEKKFLKRDQNRDRAFITIITIKVELKEKFPTYQTPYKLKKFVKKKLIV